MPLTFQNISDMSNILLLLLFFRFGSSFRSKASSIEKREDQITASQWLKMTCNTVNQVQTQWNYKLWNMANLLPVTNRHMVC